MLKAIQNSAFSVSLVVCSIGLAGCSNVATAQNGGAAISVTDAEKVLVEVKAGEVLQLIAPEGREDGQTARQAYYEQVIPKAEALGYRRMAQLNVRQSVISEYDPGAFIFFAWPSEDAARQFAGDPNWPELKATRPDGWNELKIYDDVRKEDLTLSFDPAKDYSVVVAWFDPDNPGDYERYLGGIEAAVAREGGRFIYKMHSPSYEVHASDPTAPGQVTFVEWSDRDGFARVQQSEEYRENAKYFSSGLTRFEFHWLTLYQG